MVGQIGLKSWLWKFSTLFAHSLCLCLKVHNDDQIVVLRIVQMLFNGCLINWQFSNSKVQKRINYKINFSMILHSFCFYDTCAFDAHQMEKDFKSVCILHRSLQSSTKITNRSQFGVYTWIRSDIHFALIAHFLVMIS